MEDVENRVDARSFGSLQIGYYSPTIKYKRTHIKCSTIDDRVVVLGSGNMDRASWYTSQELGVAIEGEEVVNAAWKAIEGSFEEEIWRGIDWISKTQGRVADVEDFTHVPSNSHLASK